MSPALVDSRTPTTTPRMQSTNPNASKGQISSPFLFDFNGFSSNNLQRKSSLTDSEAMNSSTSRNANEANFDISFASPSVSRGAGKPSSGLSKPRLMKVRKNLGAHQVNSTPFSETRTDSSFNPFRPVSNAFGGPGCTDIKFGKSDDVGFSFGANLSNSALNSNVEKSGVGEKFGKSLPDEMRNLNIGSESEQKVSKESSNSGVFVFGSISKKSSDFDGNRVSNKVEDDMKKLNIEGSRNFKDGERPKEANVSSKGSGEISFVFGGNDNGESMASQIPDQMMKLNIKDSGKVDVVENPTNADSNPNKANDENTFVLDSSSKSTDRAENKSGLFSFTSKRDGSGTPYTDFKTPKQDSTFASTGNLFANLNHKLEFSAKRGTAKDQRLKKNRKGKLWQSASLNLRAGEEHVSRENSFQENSESPRSYSPMDFSPYQEPLAGDEGSRETSMASDESFHIDNNSVSTDAHQTVSTDATAEVLAAETQHLHINDEDLECREFNKERFKNSFEQNVGVDHPLDDCLSGAETEGFRSKTENFDVDSDASVATMTTETSFGSNMEKQESDVRVPFAFASTSEDAGETSFSFSASSSSSSTQGHLSAAKRHYRKKTQLRVGQDSYNSTQNSKLQMGSTSLQFLPFASSPLLSVAGQSHLRDSLTSESKVEIRSETYKEPDIKQGLISTAAPPTAAQESCEKWRLRGNQAYANGQLSKAEDYYTHGVNCISPNETSRSCLKALVLCYSNRAATRMALGRMREALEDCKIAAAIDPNFLKVQVRAANCYLALGEIEEAAKYFKLCLQSGTGVCLDRKLVIEASDGLQKAQQVAHHIDLSIELLRQRTSSYAEKVLQIVAEGLSISPYSEKLVEIKAEALFMLRKYEVVIQLYEQTLDSAKRNSLTVSSDCQLENMDRSSKGNKSSAERLWQSYLTSKSYFYLGKLEEALDLLEKQEILGTTVEKDRSKILESLMALAATLRELLRHKAAGNEAFQLGKHSEAIEHYTAALSCNVESRPFAAICICNRAAAYQALGQITDAIADCSLAIALDGNYPKAISRIATLHEMIRDYGQAVNDLERYISLLEKQSEDKTVAACKSTSSVNDLRQASLRLSTMEEEAKKGIPLDMYLILGVEPTGTASDIKKAYHKAALRHHPDKAGQFLARTENGDDGWWKEITEEVHKDADRLFKMIGEAYAVLSDPTKHSRYDLEEEIRNSQKKGGGNGTKTADERSASRRQWPETWKSYGNSHHRWSEASRSNRYS